MNKILDELGYPSGPLGKICLVAAFASVTVLILVVEQFLQSVLDINPIIFQMLIWGAWFAWQGYFFVRNRERYLRADPANAYRTAFLLDILPGVSLGVSQMLRPPWYGFLVAPHVTAVISLMVGSMALIAIGAGLLYMGFKTIGFDGAGFLYEYKAHAAPLTQRSIYSFIRHPLFLGGVLVSVGLSLLTGEPAALAMVTINVLILPIYSHLEDARLTRVFGIQYQAYKRQVGGFIPRLGILRKGGYPDGVSPSPGQSDSN